MRLRGIFALLIVVTCPLVTLYGSAAPATIIRADYGYGNNRVDVTARVLSLVHSGGLNSRVDDQTLGVDPQPGANKTLWLQIEGSQGGTQQLTFPENSYVKLQVSNGVGSNSSRSSRLQINRAQYGAERRFADVTARLNSQIQGDQLNLQVTNATMGRDPAVGKDKTLTVRYTYNGVAGQVAVKEGGNLNLPGNSTASSPQNVSAAGPQLPNPGNTGVSKEQQEQLGVQAMAEVYKQFPVLPDSSPETQYVQQLGRKLVSVIPQQNSWPYQFHVVAQKEINAFALPGGPIFINLGTITAADNEAELAGVMAHEMSHVYMQHSIKQMKTQQTQQGLASILGAILGQVGGVAGTLGQLGVGLGSGMLSLKYSRGDEAQADSVGAIIMYQAGYDPKAMAQFFEKLEQQGGGNGPNFLSDHPNPGNRVAAVDQEVQGWPAKNFQASSQAFVRAKQQAQTVKSYSAQEIGQGAKEGTWARQNQQSGSTPANLPASTSPGSGNGAGGDIADVSYSQVRPSGNFTQTRNNVFTMSYPDNWQIYQDQNGGGLTIAPPAGVAQGAVAYGVIVNAGRDQNASTLDQATQDLINSLQQSNSGLRASGTPQRIQVNGTEGRSVELTGDSPVHQNGRPTRERDWLVALPAGQGGLLYFVFIAPENTFGQLRPTYQRMLESLQLK